MSGADPAPWFNRTDAYDVIDAASLPLPGRGGAQFVDLVGVTSAEVSR